MKNKFSLFKLGIFNLIFIMILSVAYVSLHAFETIDIEKPITININTECNGVEFQLYRIASFSDDATFEVLDTYKKYPINGNLNKLSANEWKELAITLDGFITKDNLAKDASGSTDSNGKLTLSNLKSGLYLVKANNYETNDKVYQFMPFMIALPYLDNNDTWNYSPDINPKFEIKNKDQRISLNVQKIWKGNSNSVRPDAISVTLYENQTEYERITLSEDNNWRYQWNNLSPTSNWTITEDVPTDYYVKIERQDNTFVITNSYAVQTLQQEVPPVYKLPQTGQIWWPVPILLLVGSFCLFVGIYLNTKDK